MTTKEKAYEMTIHHRGGVAVRHTAPKDHRVTNIVKGNYRLVERYAKCQPYVVAFKYDFETNTWAQGHYFDDRSRAIDWMYENAW